MKELVDAVISLEVRHDRCKEDNYSRLFDALAWFLEEKGQHHAALIVRRESQELHRLEAEWTLRLPFRDPFDEEEVDEGEEGIEEEEEAYWYAPI